MTTAGITEQCVQQILEIVSVNELFGKKAYDVYDPNILLDITKPVNYPACGVIYGGIRSERREHDQGVSSFIQVGIFVLGESKARDARRKADRGAITALLDSTRSKILFEDGAPRIAPTGKEWRFVKEVPADLGDRGLAYIQQFETPYVGVEDGAQYYSGSGEVLVSKILQDGVLEGYKSIGTVSDVLIRRVPETLTHRDVELADKPVDDFLTLSTRYYLDIGTAALSEFGEEFFLGETTDVKQVVGVSESYKVHLGNRYVLPVLNTDDQVFKNLSAAVLREGTNYTWTNKPCGTFEILQDQSTAVVPIVDGETITVSYSAPEQRSSTESEDLNEVFAVRVEGLNNVNSASVVLEAYHAIRDFSTTRYLQSSGIEKNKQTLVLVADPARNSKYYRELKI